MTSPPKLFLRIYISGIPIFKEHFAMADQVQSIYQKHCIDTIFVICQMSEESYLILKQSAETIHNLPTLCSEEYQG